MLAKKHLKTYRYQTVWNFHSEGFDRIPVYILCDAGDIILNKQRQSCLKKSKKSNVSLSNAKLQKLSLLLWKDAKTKMKHIIQ